MGKDSDVYSESTFNGDIRIFVEKVRVEGNGVIFLTGPSSCGKGEVAKSLCKFLSLSEDRHLSMGEILRRTYVRARNDKEFRDRLSLYYNISNEASIFDEKKNRVDIINKARSYEIEIMKYYDSSFVSQLDWLEFCVMKGLLVPDAWTVSIMDAIFESSPELKNGIIILDGYPRTVSAAENILSTFERAGISIIKVLHLSITKQEMKSRALSRKRKDDTEESLERRYQFYIDKVQPCIDYLKFRIGSSKVAIIDAHQPVFNEKGDLDLALSINEVTLNVVQALGLPGFLLDIK